MNFSVEIGITQACWCYRWATHQNILFVSAIAKLTLPLFKVRQSTIWRNSIQKQFFAQNVSSSPCCINIRQTPSYSWHARFLSAILGVILINRASIFLVSKILANSVRNSRTGNMVYKVTTTGSLLSENQVIISLVVIRAFEYRKVHHITCMRHCFPIITLHRVGSLMSMLQKSGIPARTEGPTGIG